MQLDKNQKIALVFLVGLFILLFAKGEFKTLAIYEDDYDVERESFLYYYEFPLETSGLISLSEGVDLNKIIKLTFSITGCSSNSDIYLNNKKVGSISTSGCENLYYSDQGDEMEYQHYSTSSLELFVKTPESLTGYELTNNLMYNFVDTFEELSFTKHGVPYFVIEPIITRHLKISEEVDCTRNSHCPSGIMFQGELRDATCNQIYHKCAIGQTYFKPDPIEPEETTIPWFGIIIVGFLTICVLIVILYWDKIFKR